MFLNTLSGRFLVLTVLFVMLAEVLIFVPSIARFREDYLLDRLERSQIASLALLAGDGMVDFIGNAALRSDASQFETPNAFLDQDGFVLLDASLVYTADSGLFSIGVHGKNLLDKEYIVAGYNFVAGTGQPGSPFAATLGLEGTLTGFYGDPQRFFVTAEINF